MNTPGVGSIRDAEMFVAIVEAASLSAAARKLGRSQPTVSRQLSTLESRLGTCLVERTTRRLHLTAAGRTYYERCSALIQMARETDALVSEMNGALRGSLRVSAPPSYARRRIAPLLPELLETYPDLRLELILTGDRAAVVGERLDLVVRLGPLDDSTLSCRLLSVERFVLCAAPQYLRRCGAPKTIRDLATRPCLVTETFGLRRNWVFSSTQRRRAIEVPALLQSDDLEMLREAARLGLGISALPEYLVTEDLKAGALSPVLAGERLPSFRAHAVLPSAKHATRRVRAFVDFLAARLRTFSRGA